LETKSLRNKVKFHKIWLSLFRNFTSLISPRNSLRLF
jgi:hypothetical protein